MAGPHPSGQMPKILLAKPPGASRGDNPSGVAPAVKIMRDEGTARPKLSVGSLKLVNESWEHCGDRLQQLATENTDFTVVGVLGPPGVGKSTVLNELYGFDGSAATGALPAFGVQTEEMRAAARHCTGGIDVRISAERFILLDTQAVVSAAGLLEGLRPDGSSASGLPGAPSLPAEVAQEMRDLQLAIYLCSICHLVLVLSEGLQDPAMWRLMRTVEMLKYGIPDLSVPPPAPLPSPSASASLASDASGIPSSAAEAAGRPAAGGARPAAEAEEEGPPEYFADVLFVHTRLRGEDCSSVRIRAMAAALAASFTSPPFHSDFPIQYHPPLQQGPDGRPLAERAEEAGVSYWVVPLKGSQEALGKSQESCSTCLQQLRHKILAKSRRPFARSMSEKEWLRSSARIWEAVRSSPILVDYAQLLQSMSFHRR